MGGIRGITLNKIKILLRKITMKIPISAQANWCVVIPHEYKKDFYSWNEAFGEYKENPHATELRLKIFWESDYIEYPICMKWNGDIYV